MINCLEKLICDFFWDGSCDENGMHNINWIITQCPKLLGGLGIGNFHHRNSALLTKWIRRFLHERDALWRQLMWLSTIIPLVFGRLLLEGHQNPRGAPFVILLTLYFLGSTLPWYG